MRRAEKEKITYLPVEKLITVVKSPSEALEACMNEHGTKLETKVSPSVNPHIC